MTRRVLCWIAMLLSGFTTVAWQDRAMADKDSAVLPAGGVDRSPVDLALSPDGAWLLSANQTSNSISLVNLEQGRVVAEVGCGQHPVTIVLSPDGRRALVSTSYSGNLEVFEVQGAQLRPVGSVHLGFEPHGIAVSRDGRRAYVALAEANEVAFVDLESLQKTGSVSVGRWPRYLALSPDGARLAVGASGDGGISVVDVQRREKLYDSTFQGLNIGHVQISPDGLYAYFPWMVYADRPITRGNIREGWVLGNRVARVRLDGPARREALAIDPRGRAVGDPHGLALSPDGNWLLVSASGTHELVAFRLADLPLRPDGPGDHLRGDIAEDSSRFFRVPLGGRPMAVRCTDKRALVANYLGNSVQMVDLEARRVERVIELGGASEPSLARRGEAIFFDAQRSADGWYSCHSCHYETGTNAVTMDTKNDGSFGTYKMVLSLRNVESTGPWFWHGWQDDFQAALRKSMTDTMQGPEPSDDDVRAMAAFLSSRAAAPNSRRLDNGRLSEQAERGRQIFSGEVAGCAACHQGPHLTDGQIHDVGLASEYDVYHGYNTPSLLSIANRVGYLHHGRAHSLDELLTDLHSPKKVSGTRDLTESERADLIEYLRSL